MDVQRTHPAETGDSEAVQCPNCKGTGKNRYGNTCGSAQEDIPGCWGSGFLLQQRVDPNTGRFVRVTLVD